MICLLYYIILIINLSQLSHARHTLHQSQPLFVNQTLVSAKHIFELGFFCPNNSDRLYLGLWYKNIPDRAILWVANRDRPLSGNDTASCLKIGPDKNLRIEDGNHNVVWTTNVSVQSNRTLAAVLTDRGDFTLQETSSGLVFWESFNYPTDTLLPGMTVLNSRTGEARFLSSWKTEDDPSPGLFLSGPGVEQPTEGFVWKGAAKHWRSGPWNGRQFIGIAIANNSDWTAIYVVQDYDKGSSIFVYSTFDESQPMFMKLTPSGSLDTMRWMEKTNKWSVTRRVAGTPCDHYGTCGRFGVCDDAKKSSVCECLKGFKPRSEEEWRRGIWRSGCVRRTDLFCKRNTSRDNIHEDDGFLKLSGMKLPDQYVIVRDVVDAKGCEEECLRNCSCDAYAYPQGIGCMSWSGNVVDTQQLPFSGEDLFLRLASSELDDPGGKNKNTEIIISFTSVSSFVVLSIFVYFFRRPKSTLRGGRKNNGKVSALAILREDSQEDERLASAELLLIDFVEIVASTDNFSEANKLGHGGFGTVYKGTMETGERVAVKRLESDSRQGVEEFKNEILLISKLQHRNLVKLLGCCIHGEEKLLVYEYMKNKSLDAFLFDSTKKQQLDWSKRFHIIQGVARGLLYLHRDSCLRVIHRDLKASNVLLDDNMNPKIAHFGLARAFQVTQELANTRKVVGTFGYMSPEYAIWGVFSEKSDVYSFGVLMLEIISGKRNSGFFADEDYLGLISHAWKLWNEQRGLNLMDDMLVDSNCAAEATRCIHIGLLCIQDQPGDRPTMFDVIFMMSSDVDIPEPKQPTFTLRNWLESTSGSPSDVGSANTVDTSFVEGR